MWRLDGLGLRSRRLNEKNLSEVGPFFDERKLRTWLQELATRLSHAAVILASGHEGVDRKRLATRVLYLGVVNAWVAKYSKHQAL